MDASVINEEKVLFALIQWEDEYTNVVRLDSITFPRKATKDYKEGELIRRKFQGSIYNAIISEISGESDFVEVVNLAL